MEKINQSIRIKLIDMIKTKRNKKIFIFKKKNNVYVSVCVWVCMCVSQKRNEIIYKKKIIWTYFLAKIKR